MNYLYAICVIAAGLILAGMAAIDWLAREQEKRARKKPEQKNEEDFWPEYQPAERRNERKSNEMTTTKVESRNAKVENQPVSQQAAPVPPAKQEVAEQTQVYRQPLEPYDYISKLQQQHDALLAALKDVLPYAEGYKSSEGAIERARAAIAAAEGSDQ